MFRRKNAKPKKIAGPGAFFSVAKYSDIKKEYKSS